MADNFAVTPGSGGTVATDELTINATAAHVQRVKMVAGKDGTYVGDVSGRLVDGDTNASAIFTDVRWLSKQIKVTPTVSTTPAYTAKDAVGSNMTFSAAARANGGTGRITKVVIEDKGQQMKDLSLAIFNTNPAAATDNAIFAPSDAELASDVYMGAIQIGAGMYDDYSTNSAATWTGSLPFVCAAADTALYGVLVARGTPTYTSTSDIVVTITVDQD